MPNHYLAPPRGSCECAMKSPCQALVHEQTSMYNAGISKAHAGKKVKDHERNYMKKYHLIK